LKRSLNEWREEYVYFSQKASETNRTLALGGLAIIWLFKNDNIDGPLLEARFLLPLFLLALSLTFDLLHYLVGAFVWHAFFVWHEENTPEEKQEDIKAPSWKRNLVTSFFYLKICSMIIAYILLIIILGGKLF
jgi:hypothetical protein